MRKKYVVWALTALYALVLTLLSYWLQMYQFTALEEVHIMLYDTQYISVVLSHPAGLAQIVASLCSQMFICRFAGPLIMGIVYWLMIYMLTAIVVDVARRCPLWLGAIATMPSLCLMLCLENSAYMLQGTMAMLLCVTALWLYTIVQRHTSCARHLYTFGIILSIFMYWATGSAAICLSLCCLILTVIPSRTGFQPVYPSTQPVYTPTAPRSKSPKPVAPLTALGLSLTYPIVTCAVAYLYYRAGHVDTLEQAFTPAMYYDMGSTYYMYLYAMGSLVIYVLLAAWQNSRIVDTSRNSSKHLENSRKFSKNLYGPGNVVLALVVFTALVCISLRFYGMVHSRSNYENQQQRYYARHGMWDQILEMPYDGAQTPYTSYRFLALAHKGRLAQEVGRYRPFISYIFENKPKVKKRDQQVYSDIWYGCDYMSAARKAAFDTDIVTPGAFNPYETLKLAEINIVYGDYGVAEKLITWLEKTLFYKKQAAGLRQYLYDDSRVESDPMLGPKRRAINPDNEYLSPKGIMRDLKYVIDQNPEQQTARQFYDTFLILTNQHENR